MNVSASNVKTRLSFIVFVLISAQIISENAAKSSREGKIFSLFNLVRFANERCSGLSIDGGTPPAGICFTASECINLGGSSLGSCAAGFGVCCGFVVSLGGTVTQNGTCIQTPMSFGGVADDTFITYQVNRLNTDVCFLRLDLQIFTIFGPANTLETNGGECVDTFSATTSTGMTTICGENSGEHLFIDFGMNMQSTLTFTFGNSMGAGFIVRNWKMVAHQIPCQGPNTPPSGCLQYHTSLQGQIKTFNFDGMNGHLANQRYSSCIRQAKDYCCIEYQVCPSPIMNAFTLDVTAQTSRTEMTCNSDYVVIAASSATCFPNPGASLRSSYCGATLNFLQGAQNGIVCDCTPPFAIEIATDNMAENVASFSRGICLNYRQILCP